MILRGFGVLALLGAAWSAAMLMVIAQPGPFRPSPFVAVVPVVVMALPAMVAAGLRADALVRARTAWAHVRSSSVQVLLGAAGLAAFGIATLKGLTNLPDGNPLEADGKFFINDHGDLHEIARFQYDHAIVLEEVVALGFLGGICMVSALVLFLSQRAETHASDERETAASAQDR